MEEYRKFFDDFFEHFSPGAVIFFTFFCFFLVIYGFIKRLFLNN